MKANDKLLVVVIVHQVLGCNWQFACELEVVLTNKQASRSPSPTRNRTEYLQVIIYNIIAGLGNIRRWEPSFDSIKYLATAIREIFVHNRLRS